MDFKKELTILLNKISRENNSNTPDFILAEYMIESLNTFEKVVNLRDKWGIIPSVKNKLDE